jgi:hypothetical protein
MFYYKLIFLLKKMKYKIIGILVLLFLFVVLTPSVKAYTLSDLMAKLSSLQQQVTGLKSELSANALSSFNTWTTLGNTNLSYGPVTSTSVAVYNGTPYVVYTDWENSTTPGGATVMKYDGSNWVSVGNTGFSVGPAFDTSIAIDSTGTPYVAYVDAKKALEVTVMRYDKTAGEWVLVGSRGFSPTKATDVSIAIDQTTNTPYVVFDDRGDDYAATVMEYTGSGSTGWQIIGGYGFSGTQVFSPSIVINNGTPYVAYALSDGGLCIPQYPTNPSGGGGAKSARCVARGGNPVVVVMKYDSVNDVWNPVGSSSFSTNYQITYVSLAFYKNTPYVAFMDAADNDQATVIKLDADGTDWDLVGKEGFSVGGAEYISIAINSTGTPYVAYLDDSTANSQCTVMKFDGSNWDLVGTQGFSAGQARYTSLAVDNSTGDLYLAYQDDGDNNFGATVTEFVFPPISSPVSSGGGGRISGGMSAFHAILNAPQLAPQQAQIPKYIFTKTLTYGMKDLQVENLQKVLNEDKDTALITTGPGSTGEETNYFDNATLSAVMRFQIKDGLKIDGVVGQTTRTELMRVEQ